MFCTQDNQYFSPAVPGTREKLNEILDSKTVQWKIETIRSVRQPDAIRQWGTNTDFQRFCLREGSKKKTGETFKTLTDEEKLCRWANSLKESLPCLVFGAREFDEVPTKKDAQKLMRRRVLAGIHLSGLFMFDVDHVDNPREIYEQTRTEGFPWEVVFAHLTSSGKGLRLVCKVRKDIGNIADNQVELAEALGVKADASCIDASRISYAPMRSDVYFLNEEELISYYDKEFDEQYCQAYREGKTGASPRPLQREGETSPIEKEKDTSESTSDNTNDNKNDNNNEYESNVSESLCTSGHPLPLEGEGGGCGGGCYHGVPYARICEAWQAAQGGSPAVGDRHQTMLRMALDLRYICDNDPKLVSRVLGLCGFVQDVIRERGEGEVDGVAAAACQRQRYSSIPKRLQKVLESVGVHASDNRTATGAVGTTEIPYDEFAERLEPLLCTPYAEACRGVSRRNWLGAVWAAGAMYCTLLTRCWYRHFDGGRQRMNPQVLIIGHPASGKSFAKYLDDHIMTAMRDADQIVREQEQRYKQEQKKRGTSSKAQKQDALVEPEGMIRYLPTKTSNNIFFRRLKRAKEIVEGEVLPLHLYMFDSELDSSLSAQSGGAWIGKHDLELKAFHNELSGVDYANGDSINDILPVLWNSVTTGTTVSLYKKFNMRNINDGLCSRVAIFPMDGGNFQMVRRGLVNQQTNDELTAWGRKLEQLHGELPIGKLIDHVYTLCQQAAEEAQLADDLIIDYLRKRAVFYATWFTVPRILARQYDEFRKTGVLDITQDDLKFATLMFDTVIWFQDYFFGQMLVDAWENAAREYVPRRKNSKNADAYEHLPESFTIEDVMRVLDIGQNSSIQQCRRWVTHNFIQRVKKGKYKKLVKVIIV